MFENMSSVLITTFKIQFKLMPSTVYFLETFYNGRWKEREARKDLDDVI